MKGSLHYMRRYLKNTNFCIGLILVGIVLAMAVVSIFYTPYDPNAMRIANRLQPPSSAHWMGTDEYGRDVLSRVMSGAQTAIIVGLISVGIGMVFGVLVGAVAGFQGRWADEVLMRIMDGIYAFPAILFALMIVAVLGTGMFNTTVAIGVVSIPIFARITRAGFLTVKEKEFVEAARAVGSAPWRIIQKHILPNISAPLTVQATVAFATAIISEASLSYLGLGTQPPDPSWGRMLKEAQNFLGTAPWTAVFPGVFIALAVLGFNLLGDGIRDVLDPRTSKD